MALLISKNEAENPRIVPLGNAVLFIGRDPNSGIYIDASEISRNHASISFVDGNYILRDNGSTNGSFLNGIQTSEGVLAHGDEIRFGPYIFAVDLLQMSGGQEPEEPANLERRGNAYRSSMTFKELKGHEDKGVIKILVSAFATPREEQPLETTTKIARKCLPAIGPIQFLSLEARGVLSSMGAFQQASAGERLLIQGATSSRLIFIISGSLESRHKEDGKDVVLGTVESGEWIGETDIFENQPALCSIEATEPVDYWTITTNDLELFINDRPDDGAVLMIGLAATLGRRFRQLTKISDAPDESHGRRRIGIYAWVLICLVALCVTPWFNWRRLSLSYESTESTKTHDQIEKSDRNEAKLKSDLEDTRRALEIKSLEAETYANELESAQAHISKLKSQRQSVTPSPKVSEDPEPQASTPAAPVKPQQPLKPTAPEPSSKSPIIEFPPEITLIKETIVNLTNAGKKIGNAKFPPGRKFAPIGIEGDNLVINLGNSKSSIPIANTNFHEALDKFKSEQGKALRH